MMKKLILSSVAAATLAGGMAVAFAAPAFADSGSGSGPNLDACSTNRAPIAVNGVNPGSPSATGGAQVCLAPNSANPVLPNGGSVTASGSATNQSGYVIAQGGDHNKGALAGYIGVSGSATGGFNVVGCNHGDFTNSSGDNVIVGTNGPGPQNPVTGSCSAVPAVP